MEVEVNDRRQRSRPRKRAGEVAERMRRRNCDQHGARRETDTSRCGERRPCLAGPEIGRSEGTGSAVHVTQLGTRFADRGVRVPAAAAEERRLEPELAHPPALCEHALAGLSPGRASVIGSRPVRVLAERSPGGSFPRSLEPLFLVLSSRSVGRAQQRRDRESSRSTLLKGREARPDLVVEGSFDVAGDDRVPFPRRVRHQRTSIALRSGRPGRRRPHDRGARSPRP